MNTATQIVATLTHWNKTQPQKRKSLMDDFRGIKPITNLELRIKASNLEKELDRTLLDVAVFMEFVKLSVND